jgi:hypothetical protein
MLVYPSGIDVSTSTLRFLSGQLRRHRRAIGSRRRRLTTGRQALLVIRAAREHGIIDALAQADVPCWADKGLPRRRRHGPHPVLGTMGDPFPR